jgi:4-hydroxyphenylpyruvate dioxygenase
VCLDSFHILSKGHDPAPIRAIPGEKIFFLQLADAPTLPMDVLPWSRHHRLFPGQGDFDLTAFTGHVLATGYRGPLSLEVFNDVFRQADPRPAAVDALRSLLALKESLGVLELPAAPALTGHAFAEVVTDPGAGRVLASLGFARTGVHRTKPVELWEQGEARVVVNEGGAAHGAVGAVALVSADPARSAARAEALLAPVLPRVRGPREADLASVAAPDGTQVFLCGDGWRDDFASTGETAAGAGILGIDHVALTQPFDHFEEAALFYRSVFGLTPSPVAEFAAPFGLVRSRSVAAGEVRLTLEAAVVRRGTWRSPARTRSPRPRRCGRPGRPCWTSPATTTTTWKPGWTCRPRGWPRCGSVRCSTTGTSRASSCTSTPRSPGRGCSSRWCSGSAGTAGSAWPTRRCGWPPTAPGDTRPHR